MDAVLTTVKGRVLVAWQAWRDGQADILLGPVNDLSKPINVSKSPADDWSPAVAAGPSGVFVAFDSYRNGNYDVFLASLPADGDAEPTITAVANSGKFEARPTLGVDSSGRAWVAYEERSENWGKDFGKLPDPKGSSLYATSAVKVRVVDGTRVLETTDPAASLTLPRDRAFNSYPRLTLDSSGRPWLFYRHRAEWSVFGGAVMTAGPVWIEFATTLAGKDWTPPQPLPRSDGLLDNRPALVARPTGGILAAYSGDGRLHRGARPDPRSGAALFRSQGTPPGLINNDVFIAAVRAPSGSPAPEPSGPVADVKAATVPSVHPNEAEDVARMRAHRIECRRQDVPAPPRRIPPPHRDLDATAAADGALEDMWRYAIDVGRLDWIGNGDHDNGGGKEYTWWLTQKTTDLYHAPRRFTPMFTYERSVQYPGRPPQRDVRRRGRAHACRGCRATRRADRRAGHDDDTEMLYDYLNELGGICASHTSATGDGHRLAGQRPEGRADSSRSYQGIRDSYEHLGAPRVAADGPKMPSGGWQPLGHGLERAGAAVPPRVPGLERPHLAPTSATPIALAEEPTRAAIFDAFQTPALLRRDRQYPARRPLAATT